MNGSRTSVAGLGGGVEFVVVAVRARRPSISAGTLRLMASKLLNRVIGIFRPGSGCFLEQLGCVPRDVLG